MNHLKIKNLPRTVGALVFTVITPLVFAQDEGIAVIQAVDAKPLSKPSMVSSATVPATQSLKKALKEFGLEPGSKKTASGIRVISIQPAFANVEAYDPDFMQIRESLAVEAQLAAKRSIIESLSSDAKALRTVTKFDNPVMKQIEEKEGIYKKAIEQQQKQAEAAQAEAAELLRGVDDAQADLIAGATFGDRFMELLEASIKKLDAEYDPSQLDENKKKRLEDLKKRYDRAKKAEEAALAAKSEVEAKEAELVDSTKKRVGSSMAISAEMPLFGATVIQSADRYNDLDGELEVAVAVVWSQKLEEEARRVFTKGGNLEPKPGKPSLAQWIEQQDLEVMVGPRRYIADDGSINFLGFSAVEVPSDSGMKADAISEAELFSKQAALLSLLGEVSSTRAAQRMRNDRLVDGKVKPETYKAMVADMKEEVSVSNFRGLETITTEEVIHPATGKRIYVSVANINSMLAKESDELMANTYALLKEFNAIQSVRQGQKQGMIESAEETRNNAALIQQGRTEGRQAVNQEYENNLAEKAARGNANKAGDSSSGGRVSASGQGGQGQSGTFMNRGTIERDF